MATDTLVVGAGPYGLSLAAQLRGRGIENRIFGTPMQTWSDTMPRGMQLKSEGFASSLYGPQGRLPLSEYCAREGIDYARTGKPVALNTFVNYGRAFASELVPHLEQKNVVRVAHAPGGYEVELEDGECCRARRVVVAAGVTHFAQTPECLERLDPSLAGHASKFTEPSAFAGKQVVVVGAGASALDHAALLIQAGAHVDILTRREKLHFLGPPEGRPRTLMEELRAPQSGLGPGWRSRLATDAPLVYHMMPERFRTLVARKHLGPAGCWWTRGAIEREATLHTGVSLEHAAEAPGGGVTLTLRCLDGSERLLRADHVIAATGYKPLLSRLGFLTPELRNLASVAGAPKLSRNLESSSPGLYFMGLASVYEFGPLVRFAFGAGFSAARLSRHLAGTAARARARASVRPVPQDVAVPA